VERSVIPPMNARQLVEAEAPKAAFRKLPRAWQEFRFSSGRGFHVGFSFSVIATDPIQAVERANYYYDGFPEEIETGWDEGHDLASLTKPTVNLPLGFKFTQKHIISVKPIEQVFEEPEMAVKDFEDFFRGRH